MLNGAEQRVEMFDCVCPHHVGGGPRGGAVLLPACLRAKPAVAPPLPACAGKSFLTGLASREHANPAFNFLKPTHSLFAFFTGLCDAYSRVLMPPKELRSRLEKDVADRWARGRCSRAGAAWQQGGAPSPAAEPTFRAEQGCTPANPANQATDPRVWETPGRL